MLPSPVSTHGEAETETVQAVKDTKIDWQKQKEEQALKRKKENQLAKLEERIEEIEEKIEKCMKNSRNPMSFVNTITAALLNGAVDEESVIDELERIVQKRKKEIL